jgi:hypothetical protein
MLIEKMQHSPLFCRICGGPKLGHKEEEAKCKQKEYKEEEKQKIQKVLSDSQKPKDQ